MSNNLNKSTKDEQYLQETNKNYVRNYASLVADNIVSYYKIYGNTNPILLQYIFNEARDEYKLSTSENAEVHNLVMKTLKEKYNLKLLSENHNDIMKLKEID